MQVIFYPVLSDLWKNTPLYEVLHVSPICPSDKYAIEARLNMEHCAMLLTAEPKPVAGMLASVPICPIKFPHTLYRT